MLITVIMLIFVLLLVLVIKRVAMFLVLTLVQDGGGFRDGCMGVDLVLLVMVEIIVMIFSLV